MHLRRTMVWLVALAVSSCAQPALAAPPEQPGMSAELIDLTPEPSRDAAIERRLESVYAQLDSLDEVTVEVEAGVVHLKGQVFELDASNEAESIARRVDGVVTVDNGIEQIHSVERRIRPLWDRLRAAGVEFLAFAPLLLLGLVIIASFWLLARLFGRLAQRRRKLGSNVFVREVVGQLIRAGIIVLGVVLALELMGATTLIGAVLGTAGVVGLALGFAFRDMAENYIASLLLSIRQPFEPNDLVALEGQVGRVVRLTSRATILLTLDGNHVRIPNSTVFKGTIVNYTRNPERRFEFEVGVAVEADLSEVQELAVATVAATPGVLADPGPCCYVERFGDSNMIVSISGWIDQREASWFKVGSEVRRRIKVAFDRHGVEVPEPIYQIRTHDLDHARAPSEIVREAIGPSTTDVSPEQHLIKQVDEERHEAGSGDLLSADAPIE